MQEGGDKEKRAFGIKKNSDLSVSMVLITIVRKGK